MYLCEKIIIMDYQLEPNNEHVLAYVKMWLKDCVKCDKDDDGSQIEQPAKTEYRCPICGKLLEEKSWREVLEAYGDE